MQRSSSHLSASHVEPVSVWLRKDWDQGRLGSADGDRSWVCIIEDDAVIDIRIALRQVKNGWEQLTCSVEERESHRTVLEVPARVGETFPSKELAVTTLKERVTFELQQHHRHESGQDVRWLITAEPAGKVPHANG